jgi:hypothetical protein
MTDKRILPLVMLAGLASLFIGSAVHSGYERYHQRAVEKKVKAREEIYLREPRPYDVLIAIPVEDSPTNSITTPTNSPIFWPENYEPAVPLAKNLNC